MKQIYLLAFLLISSLNYSQDSKSLEDTKAYIVKIINEHGWEKNSNSRRLKASFEGDWLRIIVMNKKYTKPVNSGLAYNFGNVYKFKETSKRPGELAYLDIWVDYLLVEESERWQKRKLVLEIHNHQAADELLIAFKHLNKLLLNKKPQIEKFQ